VKFILGLSSVLFAAEDLDFKLDRVNDIILGENTSLVSQSTPSALKLFGQMGISLALVLVLMYVAVRLIKKLQKRSSDPLAQGSLEFQIIRNFYLSPQQKIMIVKIMDKNYLLGVTGQSIQKLDELEDIPTVSIKNADLFKDNVDRFLERFKKDSASSNRQEKI
jgi:flagellar biosynthetic protein FliO